MPSSHFQALVNASREEKTNAMGQLTRFKDFFRRLADKGVPAPEPSTFAFLTDENLRKFAELAPSAEEKRPDGQA